MKWEGVDETLARTVANANLDQAPERRRIRDAFKDVQLGIDHCLLKVAAAVALLSLLQPYTILRS